MILVDEVGTETNKKGKKKEKLERFSSSGSDQQKQSKTRTGVINCLCLYNMYEQDMLRCLSCSEIAHAICYRKKLNEKFECVKCALKNNRETRNIEIDMYYKKRNRQHNEKKEFVFKLNKRRVLKAIINQQYLNCQPRSEPSTEFLKIRFGFSSSSAARITLDLVKCQFISFFRGFNFNAELIFAEIGITEEQSEVEQEKIQRETEVENYKIGACYNKSSRVENYDGNKRKARKVKRG